MLSTFQPTENASDPPATEVLGIGANLSRISLMGILKAATAGSLELDCAIYELLAAPKDFGGVLIVRMVRHGRVYDVVTADGYTYQNALAAPRYTTDLRDSHRLIPAGLSWVMAFGKTRPDEAAYGVVFYEKDDAEHELAGGEHNVLELAICIATIAAIVATGMNKRGGE